MQKLKLGIDIGRVIIGPAGGHGVADTSFLSGSDEDAMRTPRMPGAFEAIQRLTEVFGGRVWLVSKCGPRIESRTRRWLKEHRFFDHTGVASGNLRFCRERPQKANHCRELGITEFLDDRLDVLSHLRGITPRLYLFGPQRKDASPPEWTTHVLTWSEAERAIVEGIEKCRI